MTDTRTRATLADDAKRFQLLVEAVTDYALYLLDVHGNVASWNSGAQRAKGYLEHEIVGQHVSRFYTDEDKKAGLPALALDTAAREGRFEKEGWRLRKDGTRFWANVIIDPIRDEQGTLIGYAKITRDITEKKQAEEALEAARAEAHQSQKMAAIAQLASGIAHDFNNLLTIIMGNLDMLKRAKEERRPRLIDNALHAVGQAQKMTSKLLVFSRRQPVLLETLDLNRTTTRMSDMLAQSLRGDISLELDLAEGGWPVDVDATQFQTALINLTVNARDSMPEGGTVRVKTENTVLRHRDLREVVAISVSDTGTGIPADVLSKVFEPFFSTKEVGKGTGLGLTQVYGFAQQAGGSVDIRSEVGRGTAVTIYLPRSRAVVKSEEPQGAVRPSSGRALRVLLVEDNVHVAEITVALLTEQAHTVSYARSGDEALARLQAGETYDVVFSDLVMPGKTNGLSLARAIREQWPALPVLLVTGYSDAIAAAKDEGFVLLTKPYQPEALMAALQQVTAVGSQIGSRPSNVIPLARSAG